MSKYYSGKRSRNIYDPAADAPFKISRSKIDLFLECPRCFYVDRRLGVGRPPGYPFSLNSAVDALLKKEFDVHRAAATSHPLMGQYGIVAVPYSHKDIDTWRENFKGVQYHHEPTNLTITGAIDDVWITEAEELLVVDYKSTAKNGEISIDAPWQESYKRQMEVYQWLLRKNGHTVSNTGYFVYVNGKTDRAAFDGKLEFDVHVIPYEGSDTWVEPTIQEIHTCLNGETVPDADSDCDYCTYRHAVSEVLES